MKKILSFLILLTITISLFAVGMSPENDGRRFLLRDEGLSQLSYVDMSDPNNNWHQSIPNGRDLQLVGNGRLLIGTGNGYEERLISNGEKVAEISQFPGTITARRLRNKNTILVGLNWQGQDGITLVEINQEGKILNKINYPEFEYVRLLRETPDGTFLITANRLVFEGNRDGEVIWSAGVGGRPDPHAWQALRLNDGNTILAAGYGGGIQVFNKKSNLIKAFCGPEEERGNFYSGMQILHNGNILVTNWQGHGPNQGNVGTQLLEFSPEGELVWSWKQDPEKFSSLQGVICLDGLDMQKLHIENENGMLAPVE